jgi:hypothetical protein
VRSQQFAAVAPVVAPVQGGNVRNASTRGDISAAGLLGMINV